MSMVQLGFEMNMLMPVDFKVPDGMVLVRKGGRPTRDDRNVAVFMARWWRTVILNEPVKRADDWILKHWQSCGGITEEASIRRAIRLARKGPLANVCGIQHNDLYGNEFLAAMPFECDVGSVIWEWQPDKFEANELVVRPAPTTNLGDT